MLYKENIIQIIKEMELPLHDYWISAGAGLVIHGVKESTSDIDLGCTPNLFEQYIKNGYKYQLLKNGIRCISINEKVELLENWLVNKIEIIDGLPVACLESIKEQKRKLGREKDINDIILIEKYLHNA